MAVRQAHGHGEAQGRAGGLFEQAPRPRGSWRKCLEQGGEPGGLEQETGAWGGCVELGCFEEKEKCQFSPTQVNTSSAGIPSSRHSSPGSESIRSTSQTGVLSPDTLKPQPHSGHKSLKNISDSGAKTPKISSSQQRSWGRGTNISPLQACCPPRLCAGPWRGPE